MKVKELLQNTPYILLQGEDTSEVKHLTIDSRKVQSQSLFICIKGFKDDGHHYVQQAVDQGASVLLVEHDIPPVPQHITILKVGNTRVAAAEIAAIYYGVPSKNIHVIGITGTNGKTSVSFLISSILEAAGRKAGMIGTMGSRIGDHILQIDTTTYTTPEPLDLQCTLQVMADEGVDDVIIEVTSMALELHRVAECHIDIGIFTNLTPDHLDDHGTMENYKKAKMKLFHMCTMGVLNADDPVSQEIIQEATCDYLSFGIDREADYRAKNICTTAEGVTFTLDFRGKEETVTLKIPGRFTVYNALAAIVACDQLGISLEQIIRGLAQIEGVQGRLQSIPNSKGYTVIVDYAHTPDALENILCTVREFAQGDIITLFGCGGDRDRTKRPLMGEIAGKHSDFCVLTTDNPRTEDPQRIFEDIETGLKKANGRYERVQDRQVAIHFALQQAKVGDVVIIAGKGHENYQEIEGNKIHFDDAQVAQEYLLGP